jgi:protein involved in polysaccharide export with SLBB domain
VPVFRIRYIIIALALLLPEVLSAADASKESPATIREIQQRMRERGIREPEAELKKMPEARRMLGKLDEKTKDSLALADTADTLEEEIDRDTSVYERIIRGELIEPDSVLAHIEIFGYSVFRKGAYPAQEITDQVSVPANYLIAPGDELLITMWGRINEEHRLKVGRNGTINIPRIGPVAVGGLSFRTMKNNVVKRIQTIEGVQASVSMGELRSVTIFVVGEVARPGQYTVSALSNVTNALFTAGGITKRGSLRNIELRRGGRRVAKLDFYKFLLSGNNFSSIRLKAGDVIFVPVVKNMAAVAGSVRRSALYEFKKKTSLKDIIKLAGGFTPAAWLNRIQVDRFEEGGYQVVLDIEAPSSGALPDFEIKDGDIIRVFQIVERDKNAVYLSGNVKRPGKYEYKEGMRIGDVIQTYDALLPETYFEYAVIHRLEPPLYTERIISFNLNEALQNPSSEANEQLKPYDNIIIYHRDYFEPDRTVSIGGAVTNPGKYRLLDNMRVKDLILQAGGLTDAASSNRGELYRRSLEQDSVRTQKLPFCVSCAMSDDPIHDLELSKLDHVFIRQKKGWKEIRKVALLGEVVYAGEYVLLEAESLGDLIERAGGFTGEAYLEAAIFTRQSLKAIERKRNEEYIRTLEADIARLSAEMAAKGDTEEAQAILNQQLALLDRLREIEAVGRVVVDLTSPRSYRDFQLEDGDTLMVPKMLNTVSVMGEVFNPMTFQHDSRRPDVRHYLSLSGGMKETADKNNIYVIRANGSVVSGKRRNILAYDLQPGDAVVVPQKIRYVSGYKVFMETVGAIFQIVSTAAIIITAIATIHALRN